MGYEKIQQRRIWQPAGGLEVGGGSTFTGAVNMTNTVTMSGAGTQSVAQTVTAAPIYSGVGPISDVQTLTSGSTATVITNYGITTIWQTAAGDTDQTFKLAAPTVGVSKTISVTPGFRDVTITCTAAGTDPFYKSTDSVSIVVSSDADNAMIELVGVTSIQTGATGEKWAVLRMSTDIAYA